MVVICSWLSHRRLLFEICFHSVYGQKLIFYLFFLLVVFESLEYVLFQSVLCQRLLQLEELVFVQELTENGLPMAWFGLLVVLVNFLDH